MYVLNIRALLFGTWAGKELVALVHCATNPRLVIDPSEVNCTSIYPVAEVTTIVLYAIPDKVWRSTRGAVQDIFVHWYTRSQSQHPSMESVVNLSVIEEELAGAIIHLQFALFEYSLGPFVMVPVAVVRIPQVLEQPVHGYDCTIRMCKKIWSSHDSFVYADHKK